MQNYVLRFTYYKGSVLCITINIKTWEKNFIFSYYIDECIIKSMTIHFRVCTLEYQY